MNGLRGVALAFVLLAIPLVVAAQQPGPVYQVGIVSTAAEPGRRTVLWQALLEALRERGYVEGRNLLVTIPPSVLLRADQVIE